MLSDADRGEHAREQDEHAATISSATHIGQERCEAGRCARRARSRARRGRDRAPRRAGRRRRRATAIFRLSSSAASSSSSWTTRLAWSLTRSAARVSMAPPIDPLRQRDACRERDCEHGEWAPFEDSIVAMVARQRGPGNVERDSQRFLRSVRHAPAREATRSAAGGARMPGLRLDCLRRRRRSETRSARRSAAAQRLPEWGGPTVASDGEIVTIFLSSTYPVDPALAKQWADFMTSLVHGPELASGLDPSRAARRGAEVVWEQALACYSPRDATIYAPGDDPSSSVYAKGVLTHEYGHHIAATRLNPPFPAWTTARSAGLRTRTCAREARRATSTRAPKTTGTTCSTPGEAFAETLSRAQRAEARPAAGVMGHRHAVALSRCHGSEPPRAGRPHAVDGEHDAPPDGEAHGEDPHEKPSR